MTSDANALIPANMMKWWLQGAATPFIISVVAFVIGYSLSPGETPVDHIENGWGWIKLSFLLSLACFFTFWPWWQNIFSPKSSIRLSGYISILLPIFIGILMA